MFIITKIHSREKEKLDEKKYIANTQYLSSKDISIQ